MPTKFKEIAPNTTDTTHLFVVSLTNRGESKSGKPFVTAELSDGERVEKINVFDRTVESLSNEGIREGVIVKAEISFDKDSQYYNLRNWKVNDDPSITTEDFARHAPIDVQRCYDRIITSIKESADKADGSDQDSIAHLTLTILEKHKEAFMHSSAAKSMHHNYLHGLLYHTIRMIGLAKSVAHYYKLDAEMLICATALHDIGKIFAYETSPMGDTSVTVEGHLLDHTLQGLFLIRDEAKKGNYDPERLLQLEHAIAAHHGRLEWGAITQPATAVAEALHLIDMMDSRLNMFEEEYKKGQAPGTLSANRVFGLDNNYVYLPLAPQ